MWKAIAIKKAYKATKTIFKKIILLGSLGTINSHKLVDTYLKFSSWWKRKSNLKAMNA